MVHSDRGGQYLSDKMKELVYSFRLKQRKAFRRDTLTLKIKQSIVNIKGKILKQNESNFYLITDFETTKLNSLTAINLPTCYKRHGSKVIFNGDIRIIPSLNKANCGDLFDITKISIIK